MADKLDMWDIGAGVGGGVLSAILTAMFNRRPGVPLSHEVGKALYENKDKIVGPLFTRLSKEDERMFAGIEIQMKEKTENGDYSRDILTQLLKAMGPWASDRFRSIVICIPNPKKSEVKKTEPGGGKEEHQTTMVKEFSEEDQRVKFLEMIIDDVIRFSGNGVTKTPRNYSKGIEEVLKNLKIRNIADASSVTAEISRWWDKPFDDAKFAAKIRALNRPETAYEPKRVNLLAYLLAHAIGSGKDVRLSFPFSKR